MKFNLIHQKLLVIIFLGILMPVKLMSQDYPLKVTVNIYPPYPIRLSDFTSSESSIFVTISNPSSQTYQVAFSGSLKNEDNGMTISSAQGKGVQCFDIPPGGRSLQGFELDDLFDPDNLEYRGTTIDVIRGDQALPEGRYTLCLRVADCNIPTKFLSPIPEEMEGCGSFDVSFTEPPEFTNPECGSEIDPGTGMIPIMWNIIPPASGLGNIQYRFQLIQLEPSDRNPTDAFRSSPILFEEEDIMITSYNLLPDADLILEEGYTYAFRVTAYDPDGIVQFNNEGVSEVCTFRYGAAPPSAMNPVIIPAYPAPGDILPFSYFPLMIKYEPYDNAYRRFISDLSIVSSRGSLDDNHRDLSWPSGPLTTQRRTTGFAELTQEQSQYIAVNKNQFESSPSYTKGLLYTWNTSVELEYRSRTVTAPSVSSTFGVGMAPSKLLEPYDGDTVPAGDVKFKWITADAPDKLMPDFQIVQAADTMSPTFFNGIVDERWVIEVSRHRNFDTILSTMSGRLGYNFDLSSDESTVKAELYKEEQEMFAYRDTGKYYWRVRWMNSPDNPGDTSSYATSDIFLFILTSGPGRPSEPVTEADTTGGCISVCTTPEITDRVAQSSLSAGETLSIGNFTLQVATISSGSGSRFTGIGIIHVPFLNNVSIQTEFTNIQFNSSRQIFAGEVKAKEDRSFITEHISTTMGDVITMAGEESQLLNDFLEDGERLVSFFTGGREIGMPIGIDREIEGNRYTIAITEMEFTPERATINAVMNLNFPQIENKLIAFGVTDLCINPGGLGDEGRLYLARDWELIQDGDTQFAFKGAESADTSASSYISWDCHGFLCARIQGEVTFPRSMLVPDQADGTPGEGFVKGSFSFKACRGSNFLASINFDPFQIAGVDGWGWVASNAWIDLSDLENPPGFSFPESYGDSALAAGDSRMRNTWQGFYMEAIDIRTPNQFEDNSSSERISFGVHNVIIDATGITASLRAMNILPISQGSFEGWGISLDTINIDFVSNTFREGGISGKLAIPIFEEGENLDYHMALTYHEDHLNYLCRVFARDSLTIPMWAVKLRLRPDSEIKLQVGDSSYVSTNLSGDISISGDVGSEGSSVPGLNFQGVVFEGLKLSTSDPHFDIDSVYFSHASPQKSVAGFPVNINNISLNLNELDRPGIDFDLDLVLGDFNATFGFGVFGRLHFEGGSFSASFDGIDLNSISIDQTISSIRLQGELTFYNHDPEFGKGVRGSLSVTLPMDISASLTAQFGTIRNSPTAVYNTANYYNYWFVDGLVTFPGGIPIFSGFGIYGLGGGAYHHMRIDAASLPEAAATLEGGSGGESSRTSVRYIPDFNTFLGMKLTAVLGTQPSTETFNMDATLAAEFTSSGGLAYIGISANGYIMASLSDRGSAKIWADVSIAYHVPADGNANFHGEFNVYANVYDILTGAGAGNRFVNASFHVDKDKWYFYMGTLNDRAGLKLRLGPLNADLLSYLMVGYDIPTVLPPPPDEIRDLLYGGGSGKLGSEGAVASQLSSMNRDAYQAQSESGRGFAFGTYFDMSNEMDFAIFYASLRIMLGFDINVTEDNNRICAETGLAPGINNWYATGQIYAGLWGELGVKVDLWFIKGRFPIISLAAAIMMQGGLPNPEWFTGRAGLHYSVLGGLVEGQCNFKVEVGQKCTILNANPFSGIEFIADIRPQQEDSPANVFEQPRVSFNLPVEKILEFPAGTDEEPTLTRRFKPFISSFRLMKNDGRNTPVDGHFEMSERNSIATFLFDEALESTSPYKIEIVVQATEYFRDGSVRPVMQGSTRWQERKEVTFLTKERPDKIVPENVKFTYPVENQQFFLQGETQGKKGLLRFYRAGQSYLFYTAKDDSKFTYFARFKPIPEGESFETPIAPHGMYVDFTLPDLENGKMYALQLIRKKVPNREDQIRAQLGDISAVGVSGHEPMAVSLTPLRFTFGESSTSVRRSGVVLPALITGPNEFLLYSYYFKTSKFNTLREKMASSTLNAEYRNILFAELFDIRTTIPEYFDDFEINGLYKNGVEVMKPMLGLSAPFTFQYHTSKPLPYIYKLSERLQSFFATQPLLNISVTPLNRHQKGIPPVNSVSVGRGFVQPALSQSEVERLVGTGGGGGIASTYSRVLNANPGITSMLNGHTNSITGIGRTQVTAFGSLAGSDPSNFRLIYETSNYVLLDFYRFKSSVSRILSSRIGFMPVYKNALQRSNPALLNDLNYLLRMSAGDFLLTNGQYGIEMKYLIPTVSGGQSPGSPPVLKRFTYMSRPTMFGNLVEY